jgi:protein-disulfide isomerase
VATSKKSTPRYDLKAQDRKRDLAVRLGLTALVVVFAVGLVLYIVMGSDKKGADDAQAVRITSASLIKKDGTDEPKAVLSIYEDFQCPHCRDFAKEFGPAINKISESGAAAVDYNMVSILNATNQGYSMRAANAGASRWAASWCSARPAAVTSPTCTRGRATGPNRPTRGIQSASKGVKCWPSL